MARPKKAIRPVEKNLSLPGDMVAQVELFLFSEIEGKVPFGAWSKYLQELVREDLRKKGVAV